MYSKPSGWVKIVLITGGVIIALLTGIVLIVIFGDEYDQTFEQQLWLSTGQQLRSDKENYGTGSDNPRERMVADVMAHHLHVGMSRAQVLSLLGPPEREGIEWVVPANVPLPDSLNYELMSHEAMIRQSPESFNKWHAQHAQPDTLMRYRVGWRFLDPTSMRIEFNGRGRVKKFWVGLH